MRISFIVHDAQGKILRTGRCLERDWNRQAKAHHGETVILGKADDAKQKIVNGEIVSKTQAEIDAENPPVTKEEDLPAVISKAEWQSLKDTLADQQAQITASKGRPA